jgi:hypothetical protein
MIYTLCGSSRFPDAFALANMHLSLQGHIVIGKGMMGHADQPAGARFLTSDGDDATPVMREQDRLHFRKIDLSDAIYVVNVGGYVGSSTSREISYARDIGKHVHWMFPGTAEDRLYPRRCSPCGQRWADRACGPTHALITEELGIGDLRRELIELKERTSLNPVTILPNRIGSPE